MWHVEWQLNAHYVGYVHRIGMVVVAVYMDVVEERVCSATFIGGLCRRGSHDVLFIHG